MAGYGSIGGGGRGIVLLRQSHPWVGMLLVGAVGRWWTSFTPIFGNWGDIMPRSVQASLLRNSLSVF